MTPFVVMDCVLLTRMSGLHEAASLRELRERVAVCGENVLYYHFYETLLRPSFDYPDYHNDFAVWAKLQLTDPVLAERFGVLDPFAFSSMEELRGVMLDVIDERLNALLFAPAVSRGAEFYFFEADTVVFDTGDRIDAPVQLAKAVARMTTGSIFFHFIEARRREPVGMDDFSAWLLRFGEETSACREALQSIDFGFLTLSELRSEICERLAAQCLDR
jgi:hypothetical protein